MNSGRQIVILAAFIFLTVFTTASGQSFSLLSTDSADTALASTAPQIYATNIIPLIEFVDVPITFAFENLAKQGDINYILDQETGYGEPDSLGEIKPEPLVSSRWENVTAAYAFMVVCTNYNLTIVRDPETGVVLLRTRDHDVTFVKANIYAGATNIIPLVEFRKAPLSVGLKNLAKQAGIKCILSPKIDTGQPDTEPKVNIRWENITAAKAFAAICESYDLSVTKYPDSGIVRVEPAD